MAIPANFLTEFNKKNTNFNVIVELQLDGSVTKKFGQSTGGFTDVIPALASFSPFQNRIDPTRGFATRGSISFTIAGRDNFKDLIKDFYLLTRLAIFKVGFIAPGYSYSDYLEIGGGEFKEWSRKGDKLTVSVFDDLAAHAEDKIPAPADATLLATTINYQNTNPVDIILNIIKTQLGVAAARVDTANMELERDDWIPSLKFERVLIEPDTANKYLNELQIEAGLFVYHNGSKVDLKVFAPIKPGVTVDTLNEDYHLLRDSLTQNSGYLKNFYNRVIVYTDWDTEGDDAANFEFASVAADTNSQSSSKWNKVETKEIKSKWIRSRTYTQPSNVNAGVVIYHMSRSNAITAGCVRIPAGINVDVGLLLRINRYAAVDNYRRSYRRGC